MFTEGIASNDTSIITLTESELRPGLLDSFPLLIKQSPVYS